MKRTEPESVAQYRCVIGENPLFNQRDGRIYWEDIETGRLFRLSHETLEHECFYTGETVGGFTFQEDDALLLFGRDSIARLDASGRREVLVHYSEPGMARFNDVIADPEGRVFAGTSGRTDQSGGLYRVERDGSVQCLFKGTGCSNGLGFSPDLRRLYWTCSTRRRIFVYDYERATGNLSNERVFYDAPAEEGIPDGLTVDADGNVWSARWDGFRIVKLSPEGKVLEELRFPVPRVSSCVFGGPDLDVLYVTTAGGRPEGEGADGSLYRVRAGARGLPEFRSRIRI